MQQAIDPAKDVDGLSPADVGFMSRGHPVFPAGHALRIVELLVQSEVPIEGADVCVVGRGDLVGMPLAIVLAQRTRPRERHRDDLPHEDARHRRAHGACRHRHRGRRQGEMIAADMVKPGATVIDVRRTGRPAAAWSATSISRA